MSATNQTILEMLAHDCTLVDAEQAACKVGAEAIARLEAMTMRPHPQADALEVRLPCPDGEWHDLIAIEPHRFEQGHKALDLLRDLEWSVDGVDCYGCPVCGGWTGSGQRNTGHAPDCELKALL